VSLGGRRPPEIRRARRSWRAWAIRGSVAPDAGVRGRARRSRRAWAVRGLLVLLQLLQALLLTSCGGGGGGGPTAPPPPTSTIVFTAAGSGSGIQLASGAGSQGTTLTLDVRTTGIHDLYGVAFHLTYPTAVLRYTGATEGGVLSGSGGSPTSFQVAEAPVGNLVVGLTRLGPVPGTSAAGILMTLQFTGIASGNGALAFTNVLATDSSGNPVPGLTWAAGTVQATITSGAR
jgi:hypothetical protein